LVEPVETSVAAGFDTGFDKLNQPWRFRQAQPAVAVSTSSTGRGGFDKLNRPWRFRQAQPAVAVSTGSTGSSQSTVWWGCGR